MTEDDVKARIAELTIPRTLASKAAVQAAANADGDYVSRLLASIDEIANSDIGHVFDLTTEALRFLPMKDWPIAARRAVSSVKVREYPVKLAPVNSTDLAELEKLEASLMAPEAKGLLRRMRKVLEDTQWDRFTITELKLWPKTSAQKMAGDARGVFRNLSDMTDDELRALLAGILNKAAERVEQQRQLKLVQGGKA